MSLILKRNAKGFGVVIIPPIEDEVSVRVEAVDSDGTVHLAFNAPRETVILREELLNKGDQSK